jgi:hypothetical protein
MPDRAGSSRSHLSFLSLATIMSIAVAPFLSGQAPNPGTSATAEQRADALLRQMTVEEKIGQLNQLLASRSLSFPTRRQPRSKSARGSRVLYFGSRSRPISTGFRKLP